jgi:hypothetical protein
LTWHVEASWPAAFELGCFGLAEEEAFDQQWRRRSPLAETPGRRRPRPARPAGQSSSGSDQIGADRGNCLPDDLREGFCLLRFGCLGSRQPTEGRSSLEALCTDRFIVVASFWSWGLRCSGPSLVVPWAWSWRTPEPAQRVRRRGLDAGRRWLLAHQPANSQDPRRVVQAIRRMAAMPQASSQPSGRTDPTSAMTRPTRGSRIDGTSPTTAGTANPVRPRTRAARFRYTESYRPGHRLGEG